MAYREGNQSSIQTAGGFKSGQNVFEYHCLTVLVIVIFNSFPLFEMEFMQSIFIKMTLRNNKYNNKKNVILFKVELGIFSW